MAIYTTYDIVGLAEDVQDDIHMISPVDNPGCNLSKKIQATARVHEWQEDELAAIKQNKHLEGSAAGTDTSTPTTMKTANCQIFKETAEISRTAERVKKYGRASEMAYQVMKRKLDMIRDEEAAIFGDAGGAGRQAGNVGAAGTARELTSIYSQVAAANITYATTNRLSGGTAITTTAELETVMGEAMQILFDAGADGRVILVDSLTGGYFPAFALSSGRNVDVVGGDLYNYVDVYRSQFGTYDVIMDRSMTNATDKAMLLLDPEFLATPILDPTQDYALAKDGDRERREIVRESTFALLNSKAAAIVDKIPTTLS